MKKIYCALQIFLLAILPLRGWAKTEERANLPTQETSAQEYYRNPKISQERWNELNPYFLPIDHPMKTKLDKIFGSTRVTDSPQKLKAAGFVLMEDKEQHLVVASHPDLKGYLVKLYYDNHDITQVTGNENNTIWIYRNPAAENARQAVAAGGEAPLLLFRILGMQRVQNVIDKYRLDDVVAVPKKWLYPLPKSPEANCLDTEKGCYPKNFILVVQDMDIVNNKENERKYREEMNERLLDALYIVLDQAHLYDSIYIDNNPFTKSNKITFIDTEEFDLKPIKWSYITPYLSPQMQKYWQHLIENGGPEILKAEKLRKKAC